MIALANLPARIEDGLGELGRIELAAGGREVGTDVAPRAADMMALGAELAEGLPADTGVTIERSPPQ